MKTRLGRSRRTLLSGVVGAGVTMLLKPSTMWAAGGEIDPRVDAIVRDTVGIDTHSHVDVPLAASDVPGPDLDLAGEMKRSGLAAVCMTFAVDYQALRGPGQAYDRFVNGLASIDAQLRRNGITRSLNLPDIRAAHESRRPTVIQAVEGAHFLEGRLERLDEAHGRGLRHLGLFHDNDASPPLGDIYTKPPVLGGLTAFGADVIRKCDKLGMLVDLAHANSQTLVAALEVASKPVIVSHTGLDTHLGQNAFMAGMMRPRLLSKEVARIVAGAGGLIGVWTHLADSPAEYARHLRSLVDIVGVDHVCIGTDTKLALGAAEGRVGERTNRVWPGQEGGFYPVVVDAMLKAGFRPDEIGRVGGGNFCRVFDAATASTR